MLMERENLDRLADMVSVIGSSDFSSSFNRLLGDLLEVDQCTVFAFPTNHPPRVLIAEGASAEAGLITRQLAEDYVMGGFRSDPVVRSWPDRDGIFVRNAEDIEPEYRRHYFDVASLARKLVLCGTLGSTRYYFSFYRRVGRRPFTKGEIDTMKELQHFVLQSVHRHAELLAPPPIDRFEFVSLPGNDGSDLHACTMDYLREVIAGSEAGLSPRESEVCAGIVMGYSTLAIALNCGISTHTVATHRKRAYAKLAISSQNELFTRYFSTVCEFQAGRVREAVH
jgi:DNA-binding CsgD family transcriptional regulator